MTFDKEGFKSLLKDKGLKITKQRLLVLEALASCPGSHLTAEEIFEKIKADCPEIGLATVYRTIQLLLELHLIDRINLDDGFARYEIVSMEDSGAKHHHYHLICQSCGKIITYREEFPEDTDMKIAEATGFWVVDHEVKLYGYCKECGGKRIEKK
jgi:Fur family ferric uptake transcriptional regulator